MCLPKITVILVSTFSSRTPSHPIYGVCVRRIATNAVHTFGHFGLRWQWPKNVDVHRLFSAVRARSLVHAVDDNLLFYNCITWNFVRMPSTTGSGDDMVHTHRSIFVKDMGIDRWTKCAIDRYKWIVIGHYKRSRKKKRKYWKLMWSESGQRENGSEMNSGARKWNSAYARVYVCVSR